MAWNVVLSTGVAFLYPDADDADIDDMPRKLKDSLFHNASYYPIASSCACMALEPTKIIEITVS